MRLRWPHWLGVGVAALLLAVLALLAWTMTTTAGARWALQRAQSALAGKLAIGASEGTLAGMLELRDLRYRDAATGIDFAAQRIRVELGALALLRLTLHVESLDAQGLRVALSAPTRPPAADTPFSLEPPLDIELDQFALRDAQVTRDGVLLVTIDSAVLAASWTGAGLELRQFDLVSPQGEAHFTAQVEQRDYYQGKGAGRFRWRAGEQEYAGRFTAVTQARLARIELQLSEPVAAKLQAQLEQHESLPWHFDLDLPAFDPRERFAKDSRLQKLGARLQGSGTAASGSATGTILLNAQTLQIEKLGFAHAQDTLAIDALLRMAQGQLRAKGDVRLAQQPMSAQLKLDWQDIVIPADLAGQVLHTRGQLDFDGSAASYAARGTLAIGPPRRLANIQLRVAGTRAAVELQQFDVVQPAGRLTASGKLLLEPQLGWQIDARARRFDPGALVAAWPGSLDFALATTGQRSAAGIQAQLQIDRLSGRLRNRAVAGSADLKLAADATLDGVLDLRSGASRVRIDGRGSRGGASEASATLDVRLEDWLPDAAGELHAQLVANGQWPDLRVRGDARGSELRVGAQHIGKLDLDFDVRKPLHPEGEVQLALEQTAAGGFEFATLTLDASGSETSHRASVAAQGTPVSATFVLQGALQEGAWIGELQELSLDARDVARLQLTQPVRIAHDDRATTFSQACFANRDMRLCLEGDLQADGAMHAKYSLQNLPFALPAALLAPELPLVVRGTLNGAGDLSRDTRGLLAGSARLESAGGELAQKPLDESDSARQLLAWADLTLIAALEGSSANATLSARLNDTGSIKGGLAVTGVNSASTGLRGELSANLPSIAVLEVLTPQLANVQGKLALQAQIAGTLAAPQITGDLTATELAMEVPELGLKLHDGRLNIAPQGGAAPLRIAGEIGSGKGKLEFAGTASTSGDAHIDIRGNDFLAADIPGVRVNLTPDLDFERSSERMTLTGAVRVQGADIDLQKLPRGDRAQAASSDVVILDATDEMQQRAQAVPLLATVAIDFGEQVKLTGFGLAATVSGRLNLRERPGEPTTGSGEIRVAGTYKAYGQDLTIRQGQLLYAQTPLDNPRLSIVAVRVVDTVTAGLRVGGTAQNPQLTVFSDPVMGQSSALSYLVAGKSLDQIGSNDGESDALRSAAQSLGAAAGGLLAKSVGKRLGVDELGIKDSTALGGAALTVGQYLSPRLYLSYGVGLFTPGEVITLRYRLGRGLSLEAENAAQNSRAGVQYRLER